jgi:hypothetical protein
MDSPGRSSSRKTSEGTAPVALRNLRRPQAVTATQNQKRELP